MLITRTPLRVSLLGGGTDFPSYYEKNGGCVLTTAINKYIYVIIKPRIDNNIRVSYTHIETTHYFAKLKHELVREAIRLTGLPNGVEIVTIGDIPAGMGLGSSSTCLVGLLKAMHVYCHTEVSDEEIAREACIIERDVLHKPIGVQDQYIATYGGLRFIQFSNMGVSISPDMAEHRKSLQDRFMLFSTGVTRSAAEVLADQEYRIDKNRPVLDKMRELATLAVKEVSRASYDVVGHLLNESWEIKRKLASKITNSKIDALYERAKKAGALGGKITGAGGGGFLLIYSHPEKKDAIRKELKELKELSFSLEPEGTKVIFNI